jgi:flagellar biosynthesis protein FliR
VRYQDPNAFRRLGRARSIIGYCAAVTAPLLLLYLANLLHLRPWIEAIPIHSARELVQISPVAKYLMAAMVSWLVAVYVVAPVYALLAIYGRLNGWLLVVGCLLVGAIIGVLLSLTWETPLQQLPFSMASTCCLLVSIAVGFSVGTKLPFKVNLHGAIPT